MKHRINVLLDLWKKKKDTDQNQALKGSRATQEKPSMPGNQNQDSSTRDGINVPQNSLRSLAIAIDLKDSAGYTPLALAVTNGHQNVVETLVGSGANVWIKDNQDRNNLHRAARNSNTAVFLFLLEKATETDVNAVSSSGTTPLMEAIESGVEGNAVALLETGIPKFILNLEETYWDKRTALGLASWLDLVKVVDLLLHARAKRDTRDQGGDTPLHEACISGNYNVAKLLLQYGSIPATFDNNNEEASVDPKHEERLANLKNDMGKTPLFCAVENQRIHVVELLLDNEANADLKDNSGESPLGIAARTLEEDIFLMVLTKVKNPSVADDKNQTPLLWLIRNNMELAATALLQRDVDMEIHPEHNMGPLHEAVRNCSLDSFSLVDRLLSKGANPLWTDSQGMTALHMAAARGFLELLKSVLKTIHKMEPVFNSKYDDK